jgi:ABC-2 type transport system ATP-binding protein
VIHVEKLEKTFRHGFWRRRVDAVRNVSFDVPRGAVFGFLGPNGAGKTTTIKILTGLIAPSGGAATIFGQIVPSSEAMKRVGFLPENPYVYPYLTPREFIFMCGRLSGVAGSELSKRTDCVLERVGIAYAADRPVVRLSKGMLQRSCLAAALVSGPELLILDEPMSGLDPVGRKEVRDVILEERKAGRTVFFSSHILSDVESMCDQVTILRRGEVVVEGQIGELLRGEILRTDVVVRGASDACEQLRAKLADRKGIDCTNILSGLRVDVEGEQPVGDVLQAALALGLSVVEVSPRRETLEDLFVKRAIGSGD